ncbi:heparan-alpha-glucosaminide N-acetyltransferase domain-containing protein [Aquimarina muelleri]|uniref:Heparan-alpha-glucosaminide N-acetyltransferase catalytic domain-containing protein n=1 Tax=Aquimarina muelleri TaxID=279356 RepID=A0A918JX22_9FLAO|nr:heparan-alpha-glucosaminide N-acetyltransferase domain-containing protein [Aquimarina muelleri]MCX2763245.1 DUF1624 domain-containing protein [Aquimarina muelleri]GGX27717.1 hypothetical protein GCM10007384_31260 [Aquimarina muelleri]
MKSQNNRILTLDLIKGGSVIGMIIIHTLLIYGNIETQSETFLGNFIRFLGRGTSIFLICMGITFMTSRNQSLKSSIKRGAVLLLVALLMNFMKFMIPIIFEFVPENYMKKFQWDAPLEMQYLYLVLLGDILQLAGMSLLIIGFIRKYVKNKFGILAIGLIIASISRELSGININIPGVNYVLDLLFSNDFPAYVYFPVFPWVSFIIIGMFFGKWYAEINYNPSFIFKKMMLIGLFCILLGGPLVFFYKEYHYNTFFYLGPGGVIYFAGWTLIFLWLIHITLSKVRENFMITTLVYCSKNLTTMYVIQWVLISWGKGIFGFRQSGITKVFLLMLLFITLTFILQKALDEIMKTIKKGRVKKSLLIKDHTL